MSTTTTKKRDGGFWRLRHDHLAALLALRFEAKRGKVAGKKALHLSAEELRVYLAMASLTVGYGKERDIVALSQIDDIADMGDRPHVVRTLKSLQKKRLYGQVEDEAGNVWRWVKWPPPVASTGNTPVASQGNTDVANPVATAVANPVASTGTLQDSKLPSFQEPPPKILPRWMMLQNCKPLGRKRRGDSSNQSSREAISGFAAGADCCSPWT